MTDFHNLDTPSKGLADWHIPLNDNFTQIDKKLEIRDIESNLSNYTPKDGAKFLATDTGKTFLGDGSDWQEIELAGKVGSAPVGAEMVHAVVHQSGGNAIASQTDGTQIASESSSNAGSVIKQAYDYVVNNFPQGLVRIGPGTFLIDQTVVLDGRSGQQGGYGLVGTDVSFRNGMSTILRVNGASGALISVEENFNTVRGMRLWGKNSNGNLQNIDLIRTTGAQTCYFSHLRLRETLGHGFNGTDIADSLWEKSLVTDCGSASNGTYCLNLGQSNRQAGIRSNWVKMVTVFGGTGDNTDAATCVNVEDGSNWEAYFCKCKTHGASEVNTIEIGSGSGLLGIDLRATSTENTAADAIYAQGRVELVGGNADSCRYGLHLDGANGSRVIGMDFRDSHSKAIHCNATDCVFVGIDEQGGADVGIDLQGNYNWVVGSYIGKQAGAGQADVAVSGSDETNHVIGSQLVGANASFSGTGTLQNTELRNGTQSLGAAFSNNGVATQDLGDPSSAPTASFPEGTVVRNSNGGNNDTYQYIDGTWVQLV